MPKNWQLLSQIPTSNLDQAREQLHAAIQLVSKVGRAYHPSDPEDQHASLTWSHEQGALLGKAIEGPEGVFQLGLRFLSLSLFVLKNGTLVEEYRLPDHGFHQANDWIKGQLLAANFDLNRFQEDIPYDLPQYGPLLGEPFDFTYQPAMRLLGLTYGNAARLLEAIGIAEGPGSPVLCWPHHFDLATLIPADPGSSEKTIGLGFSPGDAERGCPEPYFYVNLWPIPEKVTPPASMAAGYWHSNGWQGGILTLAALLEFSTSEQQEQVCREFFMDTLAHNRSLLLAV
ncbi:MAG: hypothetical protein AAF804_13675 [Bacteroidota bacterium]